MVMSIIQYATFILLLLMFLGFCEHCYRLQRQFLRCPHCGAVRPQLPYQAMDANIGNPYAVVANRTDYKCDGPQPECRSGYMKLVVRKWSWRFTRPLAWIWLPFPRLLDAVVTIIRAAK